MALQISKGKQARPIRATIYGVPGSGKSTLASKLPKPLFLDTEDGSNQLEVDRITVKDRRHLEESMRELAKDTLGYKTVVIDTADWAERMLAEHLLRTTGEESIEDFGFGKGYTKLAEQFAKLLALADELIDKGLHVVFLAHAKVQKVSPPDQLNGYDRYELKLSKGSAPLLVEWSELVLFLNFEVALTAGKDGKVKGLGGDSRVVYSTRTAAWDAKNRFGLDEVLPVDSPEIIALFNGAAAKPPGNAAKPAEEPQPKKEEAKKEEPKKADPSEFEDDPLNALFIEHEEKVNKYLVEINYIAQGQTWKDLSQEQNEKIRSRMKRFFQNIGVTLK